MAAYFDRADVALPGFKDRSRQKSNSEYSVADRCCVIYHLSEVVIGVAREQTLVSGFAVLVVLNQHNHITVSDDIRYSKA